MKATRLWLVTLIVVFAITSTLFAQGKLYTPEEADQLFGQVVETVPMGLENLLAALESNPLKFGDSGENMLNTASPSGDSDVVMFRIMDGDIVVLDGARRSLYNPTSLDFTDQKDTVFYVYGRDAIETLAREGGGRTLNFQNRENGAFSISSGSWVLKSVPECPDECPGMQTVIIINI